MSHKCVNCVCVCVWKGKGFEKGVSISMQTPCDCATQFKFAVSEAVSCGNNGCLSIYFFKSSNFSSSLFFLFCFKLHSTTE